MGAAAVAQNRMLPTCVYCDILAVIGAAYTYMCCAGAQ